MIVQTVCLIFEFGAELTLVVIFVQIGSPRVIINTDHNETQSSFEEIIWLKDKVDSESIQEDKMLSLGSENDERQDEDMK